VFAGVFESNLAEHVKCFQMSYNFDMQKRGQKNRELKLAVFDIDGTVFRSSLLIELIDGLIEAGIFPEKAKKEIEKEHMAWLDRTGTYPSYINRVVKIYFKYIGGCKEKDVSAVARKMLAVKKNRVYRFTRDLIKYLRKQKYFVLALSASPDFLVQVFAKSIGFSQGLGSVYEIKDGILTGKILNEKQILNKEEYLKDFLQKNSIDLALKYSIGVGDTENDIPFLKMVKDPIAFNPNRGLAEYAEKMNWKIVVERKDVIYKIRNFEFEDFK